MTVCLKCNNNGKDQYPSVLDIACVAQDSKENSQERVHEEEDELIGPRLRRQRPKAGRGRMSKTRNVKPS